MRQEAYFCTVKELDELGKNNIPRQLISHTHLIYSSPATLAFNSPGAEGFGVKRAGLAVPDSVMLIVSPGCCGRNTSVLSSMRAYQDRFYYLLMDETDIVTGRHLKKIPKAVAEICEAVCCDDMYYLCGCAAWHGYGACLSQGRGICRGSGKAMLYVCTDQRGQKTTDGACAAVRLFVAGTEKEKRKRGEFTGIFFTAYG